MTSARITQPRYIVNQYGESVTGDPSLDIPTGLYDTTFSVNKFGGGFESAADTTTDVWDSGATVPVYPYPATALITKLGQTADQVAMRGQNIEIQGLDANWDLVVQIKALDATDTSTLVDLATPLIRVFRKKVLANVVADSDIFTEDTALANLYSIISAGNNQTLMALYTVPNGYTAYMTNYYISVVNEKGANKTPVGTDVRVWASDRDNSYEFQLKHAMSLAQNSDRPRHDFNPYYKFGQKTDIKITTYCISEPGWVYAGFDLIVVEN